jgi:hypothetical protein
MHEEFMAITALDQHTFPLACNHVAVLGQGAAEFFTHAPTPIAVMPRP